VLEPAIAHRLEQGDERIIITGASGWLGMATLELLEQALGPDLRARVCCFGSSDRELVLRNGVRLPQQPLQQISSLPQRRSWLLHFAFLTKDRAEAMDEQEYRAANLAIRQTVIDALDRIGAEAVFVASSGAAARAGDETAGPAMRLYGQMKHADENAFAHWATANARKAVIARIFNVTGPYINKHQAYAFASFILDGLAGRPVQVRAPRPVIRSYVAIRELMSLVFAMLARPDGDVVRFDSGGTPRELGEVAEAVAAYFPGGTAQRAPIIDPVQDCYHGDGAAYASLLAAHGVRSVPLADQINESIAYLRSGQLGPA